jgi:hypothetical protein
VALAVPQLATARLLTVAQHSLRTVRRALSAPKVQPLAPVATTVAPEAATLVASVVHLATATTVVHLVAQVATMRVRLGHYRYSLAVG